MAAKYNSFEENKKTENEASDELIGYIKSFNVLEKQAIGTITDNNDIKGDNDQTKSSQDEKLENYQPPLIDAIEVFSDEISKNSVKQLELLEPLGNGNEETYFYVKDLVVNKVIQLSNGKHLRFDLDLPKAKVQALYFNQGKLYEQYKDAKTISLIGKFNINVFNNVESINIIIEEIK